MRMGLSLTYKLAKIITYKNDMNNKVILNTDAEHGKRMIEWFKSQGVDTGVNEGLINQEQKYTRIYYGVIDGEFSCYNLRQVQQANAEIITLPEEYPKVMIVWDYDEQISVQRVVIKKTSKYYVAWDTAQTIEDSKEEIDTYGWKFAKDLPATKPKVELTIEEIASKFELDVEQIRIKD